MIDPLEVFIWSFVVVWTVVAVYVMLFTGA